MADSTHWSKGAAEEEAADLNREHNGTRCSLWCANATSAVDDKTLFARILDAAGIDSATSGACGSIERAAGRMAAIYDSPRVRW